MFHEWVGYPFALCGMGCMKDVYRFAEKWKYRFPRCIFEDGDKHKGEFKRMERFERRMCKDFDVPKRTSVGISANA